MDIKDMDWSGFGELMRDVRRSMPATEPHKLPPLGSEEGMFESLLRDAGYPSDIEFDTNDDGKRRRFYAYYRKRMRELGKGY